MQLGTIASKIYESFRLAAKGKPEVYLDTALYVAKAHCSMPEKMIRGYLPALEATDMIDFDGRTIWLKDEFGPRPESAKIDLDAERRKELAEGDKKTPPEIRKLLGKIARADSQKKKK